MRGEQRVSAYIQARGRRIVAELNKLVGKNVEIVLVNGKRYRGIFQDYDYPDMNIMLADADVGDSKVPLLILSGKIIAEIRSKEISLFEPREFADYIVKKLGIRPDGVKVFEDAGVVMIYNSIRVTEHGVEGSGSLAAKVSFLLREYLEQKRRGEKVS